MSVLLSVGNFSAREEDASTVMDCVRLYGSGSHGPSVSISSGETLQNIIASFKNTVETVTFKITYNGQSIKFKMDESGDGKSYLSTGIYTEKS